MINTHSHPDHFQGSELFDQEKVKIALHRKEMEFLKGVGGELYGLFGITVPQMQINLQLEEGKLDLGDQIFKIILHSRPFTRFHRTLLAGQESPVLRRCHVSIRMSAARIFPAATASLLKKSIVSFSDLDIELLFPGHMGIIEGQDKIQDNFNIIIQNIFPYI